jgi:hypothetical protein
MAQKKLKIKGVAATETATYFGGEVVLVPQDVDEKLAAAWVKAGTAEWVEEKKADKKADDDDEPEVRAKRTRKQTK